MFKKMFALLSVISVLSVGCSTQNPTDSMSDPSSTAQLGDNTLLTDSAQADNMSENVGVDNFGRGYGDHYGYGQPVTFMVRIENVSTAMTLHLSTGGTAPAPHSPGVWTITRLFNPLFRVGQYDQGLGLEQQAEDGDPSMLAVSMFSVFRSAMPVPDRPHPEKLMSSWLRPDPVIACRLRRCSDSPTTCSTLPAWLAFRSSAAGVSTR